MGELRVLKDICLHTGSFNAIQTYLQHLYLTRLADPLYILLSVEDYEAIGWDILPRYPCVATLEATYHPIMMKAEIVIKQIANHTTGGTPYLAALPDMPRNTEYSPAHLAFARQGYAKLPTLRRDEIIVIFDMDD